MLSVTGSNTDIANLNPLRYRGYYYDTETGFYYLQTRYYDPAICRFINADGQINSGLLGTNLFAYCGNNPLNRSDSSGMFWEEIGDWFKKAEKKIEEFFAPSNIYGTIVSGTSISTTALASSLESAIKSSPRPKNIGAGTYAKQCAQDLEYVSKFSKGASNVLNVASYGAAAIDVGIGIYDNINNNASTKKIFLDATVDATVTCGSIWVAGAAGGAVGTAMGTIIPGAGNLVGAGAGFVIGIVIYAFTDMVPYNGKTARTWAKELLNSLW